MQVYTHPVIVNIVECGLIMAFKIVEEFEVQAPVQRVWEYLIDTAKVAVCIPGAELLESKDDGTFTGAVKVKVGPITMSYKGTVKFTELDEQAHQVRLVGEGREAGEGGGTGTLISLSISSGWRSVEKSPVKKFVMGISRSPRDEQATSMASRASIVAG